LVLWGLDGVGLRVAVEEREDRVVLVLTRVGDRVMESTADAAMMDPTADVAAAKSASYSKADSSST
jgi:hypothetical protein